MNKDVKKDSGKSKNTSEDIKKKPGKVSEAGSDKNNKGKSTGNVSRHPTTEPNAEG